MGCNFERNIFTTKLDIHKKCSLHGIEYFKISFTCKNDPGTPLSPWLLQRDEVGEETGLLAIFRHKNRSISDFRKIGTPLFLYSLLTIQWNKRNWGFGSDQSRRGVTSQSIAYSCFFYQISHLQKLYPSPCFKILRVLCICWFLYEIPCSFLLFIRQFKDTFSALILPILL